MEPLVEYGKIILPASLVIYAMYLTVKSFILKDVELKKLEIRDRSLEIVLPNRLQAYERICLFLERISPPNLLTRLSNAKYSAVQFHKLILDEIRNEYNHNVSQQVYMSEEVWSLVKSAKEDLIIIVNEAATSMIAESTSLDLSRKIFELSLEKDFDTISNAIIEVKKEIQQTF